MAVVAQPHEAPEAPDAHVINQTHAEVTRDVVATLGPPSRGYVLLLFGAVSLFLIGIFTFLILLKDGLGHAGYNPPVFWSVYITTFVFWIGIGHAGTLISAILFLFRSPWRTAVYRSTEAMTVFAVMTAGLFPIIHLGRNWIFYWLLPYPNERFLWPNFKSPLIWDVFAISTYLTVSTTFLVFGLIPDVAAVRDKVSGWRKAIYSWSSVGWKGTDNQWRHYSRAYLYLAALATPLVLSVHSVVSWDFAVSLVPGWHGTIFAPYFVAGAIYSGIGMVLTLIIPLRRALRIEHMIHSYHFDNLAKLTLLTGSILFYAYAMEYFVGWYSGNTFEQTTFYRRAFGPMWWAGWSMIICNAFVSQLLWFRKIRTNLTSLFIISIFVNIGMWFERYVIIVSSLSNDYIPWAWDQMNPTWADWGILLGSFGWFGMWFLLFAKTFPIVAIQEIKGDDPDAAETRRARVMALLKRTNGQPAKRAPGVVASFIHVDAAVDAIRALRAKGYRDLVVYTPSPNHEIEEALEQRVSPVRLFTLIGGLTGCTAGFAMTIWMSYDWPLIVGGKPIASIPPYVVIGFELTILMGALSTVAAVALFSVLMGKRGTPYDPRFSDDMIGMFVPTTTDQLGPIEQLLRSAGAVEVRHETA